MENSMGLILFFMFNYNVKIVKVKDSAVYSHAVTNVLITSEPTWTVQSEKSL